MLAGSDFIYRIPFKFLDRNDVPLFLVQTLHSDELPPAEPSPEPPPYSDQTVSHHPSFDGRTAIRVVTAPTAATFAFVTIASPAIITIFGSAIYFASNDKTMYCYQIRNSPFCCCFRFCKDSLFRCNSRIWECNLSCDTTSLYLLSKLCQPYCYQISNSPFCCCFRPCDSTFRCYFCFAPASSADLCPPRQPLPVWWHFGETKFQKKWHGNNFTRREHHRTQRRRALLLQQPLLLSPVIPRFVSRFTPALSILRECVNIRINYSSINPQTAAQNVCLPSSPYWVPRLSFERYIPISSSFSIKRI